MPIKHFSCHLSIAVPLFSLLVFGCKRKKKIRRMKYTKSIIAVIHVILEGHSLEGQILKLRLQYFGHFMRGEDSLEKTLTLGKCEGKRRKGTAEEEMVGQCH